MQIGIDLGATKIEYVLLDNDNIELKRDRVQTPKDYEKTIITITEIVKKLEKNSGKFNVDSKRAEISRAIPTTDIPSGLLAVMAKSYIKSFN